MLFLIIVFTIPVEIENVRLRLALAIPTGVPIRVANDAIGMLPLVSDRKRFINAVKRSNILTKPFAH